MIEDWRAGSGAYPGAIFITFDQDAIEIIADQLQHITPRFIA
ncbi:MAG TPA: hypothetical protein VKG02_26205 [Blastocatellia bacterium]|nr:hypothetical protein [Blastocatellia bacterium]